MKHGIYKYENGKLVKQEPRNIKVETGGKRYTLTEDHPMYGTCRHYGKAEEVEG